MPDFDLVTLGHACTDLLVRLPQLPERDRKLEVARIPAQGGGPAATAAVTAARLGLRAAFIGQLGRGPFGELAVRALVAAGVDVGGVEIHPTDASRLALVLVEARTAARTIVFTRGGLPGLDPTRLDRARVLAGRLLLIDDLDIPAATRAAGWAREAGVPVLLDAGSPRPGMAALVARSDICITSSHFLPEFLGTGADLAAGLRQLASLGPRLCGVTLGAAGALLWDGRRLIRQPAFAVEAIDTTGAGDVFHGAFAFGLLAGWELARTTRFAAAAAGWSCTRLGAQAGAPARAAVEALLARGEQPASAPPPRTAASPPATGESCDSTQDPTAG